MTERPLGKEHRCDECGEDLDTALPERLRKDTHDGRVLLLWLYGLTGSRLGVIRNQVQSRLAQGRPRGVRGLPSRVVQ